MITHIHVATHKELKVLLGPYNCTPFTKYEYLDLLSSSLAPPFKSLFYIPPLGLPVRFS